MLTYRVYVFVGCHAAQSTLDTIIISRMNHFICLFLFFVEIVVVVVA